VIHKNEINIFLFSKKLNFFKQKVCEKKMKLMHMNRKKKSLFS